MPASPSLIDAMTFSLWSDAGLLGHAQLAAMATISARTPVVNGPFVPTSRFADVWPVLEAWHRCGAALVAMHVKIHDPLKKSLPALGLLGLGLVISWGAMR